MVSALPIALLVACGGGGEDNPGTQDDLDWDSNEGTIVVAGPGGAWGDAVRAAVEAAAAEHDLSVTYQEGSTAPNLALLQAQAQAGRVEFDLLMVNDRTYTVAKAQGLVQAPDFSRIPNMSQLDQAWATPPAVFGDPPDALRHVVISEGLGYNTELFADRGWDPPTSWTDLYDPDYADCVILVHPSSGLSYIPMLNQIHTGEFGDYEPTLAAIGEVADQVPTFTETSIEALEFLQQGVGCLAPVSQARLLEQREQGAPVEFVAPVEGSGFLSAGWVIPTDAPHPVAAHLTLNSLISAEASQRMLEEAFLPTTNTEVTRPSSGVAVDLPLVAEYESLGYVEILPEVYDQLDSLSREWDNLLAQ